VLADELSRLNRLLESGAITWETYSRAVFAAQDAFDAAQSSIDAAASKAEQFAKRAKENIQDAFGEGLYNTMNGNFTKIGDSFVRLIQRMVAEALAAKLSEALFSGGSSGFGGFLSAIGGALFGGKAYGGPVSAGRAVPVGEHGPEIFVPDTAGTVVPVADTGRMINLTVNVQATPGMSRQTALQQGQQIGEGIQRAMARNG
jgi:hypothetical protein